MIDWRSLPPAEIERRSMEIITEELGEISLDGIELAVLKRVIHATADFGYAESLYFSEGSAQKGVEALKAGASVVTDTNMARAGINKSALKKLGCTASCFMADEDVAAEAASRNITRAAVGMERAAGLPQPLIVAVGNAPTALLRMNELIGEEKLSPALIIAVPVGFVNVVESKQLIETAPVPVICARGRRGGSTVAAAICNALLYEAARQKYEQ